jgi:hypothetical protein
MYREDGKMKRVECYLQREDRALYREDEKRIRV